MGDGFAEAVGALPANCFVVLDGALIDGLPDLLRATGLAFAPLYLEAGDEDGVRAGPYLVAAGDPAAISEIRMRADCAFYPTIWSWPGDFASLRHHLRSINLVEIPTQGRVASDDPTYETLLFRHWDPNVLAITLPLLTLAQRSRFLDIAAGLSYRADSFDAYGRAMRTAELPAKPRGLLRLHADQIAAITMQRVTASHRRIAAFLRDTVPLQRVDDTRLLDMIRRHEAEARAFGLVTEADVGRWSFLQIVSGETLARHPAIVALFDHPSTGPTPTKRLDALFDASIAHARTLS